MSALDLAEGSTLAGRYRLLRCIGEGGMGVVWAARDERDERDVALKLVRKEEADAELKRRFLREARALMALDHPNVVRVHEVLELDEGLPVMVMELLEGESLAHRLHRELLLPLPVAARVLVGVCAALEAAHARGIVHRDLKPDNVFLLASAPDASAGVRVLDFGIAKLTAVDGETKKTTGLTQTGALLGTPAYMSPEQIFGEADVDQRSDIWALGLIAYQCLSGVLPTDGTNVGQILKNIVARAVWPLRETNPDLPAELLELVDAMLERDRTKRLQTVADARRVLERFVDAAPLDLARARERAQTSDGGRSRGVDRAVVQPRADALSETLDAATGAPPSEARRAAERASAGAGDAPAAPRPRSVGLGVALGAIVAAAALGVSWSL